MNQIAQPGIFKARPMSWHVYEAQSGAVGINMGFRVLAELDCDEWSSWEKYDPYIVYGTWWVVKRDGTINSSAVDQLARCLRWDGQLSSIDGEPPALVVQVEVKAEAYNGETRYKAAWMHPEDHEGGGGVEGAADTDKRRALDARFGSLLRASAAAAEKAQPGPKPAKGPRPAAKPRPAASPDWQDPNDDIPF